VSVPLQSVPDSEEAEAGSPGLEDAAQARHQAAEIIAGARRQAETIVAEARNSGGAPSPLAALGDNAEEIIGQVRKLITKQREMQGERQQMIAEIDSLKSERDELVQRLTDAVERMEELSRMADMAQGRYRPDMQSAPPPPPPPFQPDPIEDEPEPVQGDTSLAARLRRAEDGDDSEAEDSSLAARLERAERERNAAAGDETERVGDVVDALQATYTDNAEGHLPRAADGRSFYDRHSAKLPRLEGDGGRSVLSAIGDMRPETEPKGRKGRRRKK